MVAVETPAEAVPARAEADPQAAQEFSSLISTLIPEAAPERISGAPTAGKAEEKAEEKKSSEPKKKEEEPSEQAVVLPFPVQAFVPPVEIRVPAGGTVFAVEAAKTEEDSPASAANAGEIPVGAAQCSPEAELVDAPIDVQDEPRETGSQPAADVPETAPVPTPVPAPVAAPAPAPEPSTPPAAPSVHSAAPPPRITPPRKDADKSSAEPKPEAAEVAVSSERPAQETELAFAARLSERAPAAEPARRPSPPDSRQPAPARRIVSEEAPAPRAPETETVKKAAPESVPAAGSRVPADRPAEREERIAATAKPTPGGQFTETAGPQPVPAQPARPAPQASPVERATTPNAPVISEIEPVRTEAAPQPIREISMVVPRQVSQDRRPESVEVKVLERAGQVHVAVRSADPQLNRSLGEGLGELVANLESRGYSAETWRPQSQGTAHAALAAVADGPAQQMQAGGGSESFQESGRGHHGGTGDESSGQQRRGQQDDRPRWLEMLEGAVSQRNDNSTRSTFAWQQQQ